jgi:hypothetical protein
MYLRSIMFDVLEQTIVSIITILREFNEEAIKLLHAYGGVDS